MFSLIKEDIVTQIEEIAQLVFKEGMTEQDFLNALYVELNLRDTMTVSGLNYEQQKEEKTKSGLSYYESLSKRKADALDVLKFLYNVKKYQTFPAYTDEQIKRMEAAMVNTSDVIEIEQGAFYFRELRGSKLHGALERFQVNADMNPKIIEILDSFVKKYKCNYKTPAPTKWHKRVDTVNVYMYEPITDKIKKEFVQIMSPYIRKNGASPDGEKLVDGIGISAELHQDDPRLQKIIAEYPEHLQKNVKDYFRASISLGKVSSAQEFLDMYKKYAPKLKTNAMGSRINTALSQSSKPEKPDSSSSKFEYTSFHTNKAGYRQREYLVQGNEIYRDIDYGKSLTRIYQNGLRVDFYYDSPEKKNIIERSYSVKDQTGKFSVISIHDGKVSTKGDIILLNSKITELTKKGFLQSHPELQKALANPQKSSTLRGRLMRHSMDNAQTVLNRSGGKISGA